MALLLNAKDLARLVPMAAASDAMRRAFVSLAEGEVSAPLRSHVNSPGEGKTLLMGAHVPGTGLATKIVSYFPKNRAAGVPSIHGILTVMDEHSGVPVALCEGATLTALRTGAGVCAATQVLSRHESKVAALLGTGAQAAMQLAALDAARPFSEIRIFGRRREKAEQLASERQANARAHLRVVETAGEAVDDADVVSCSTSARAPLFSGAALKPGAHVNAIGSITEDMAEVDAHVIGTARVFVDSMAGALAEAGELICGERSGITERSQWTEIGTVFSGRSPGRTDPAELTFFKSVGHAVQDVAIGALALKLAKQQGIGTEISL